MAGITNHDPALIARHNMLMLHTAERREAEAALKKEKQPENTEIKDEFVAGKSDKNNENNIKKQDNLISEPSLSPAKYIKETVLGLGSVAWDKIKETAENIWDNAGLAVTSTAFGAPVGGIGGLGLATVAGAGTLGIALAAVTGAGALTVGLYKIFNNLSS